MLCRGQIVLVCGLDLEGEDRVREERRVRRRVGGLVDIKHRGHCDN